MDGRLWGVIAVTSESELLPLDTQERLEKFTRARRDGDRKHRNAAPS